MFVVFAIGLSLATPYVKIPKNLTNMDHILLDLGKISLSTATPPKSPEGNLFSEYRVSLQDLEFIGNSYDAAGKLSSTKKFLRNFHVNLQAKVTFLCPFTPSSLHSFVSSPLHLFTLRSSPFILYLIHLHPSPSKTNSL